MPEPSKNLGKLINTYGTSPVYLQRAAIVAALSFVFFLAMLIAFYIRRHIGYFALSTAFLIVYVLTFVGWVLQRRNVVRVFENGIRYKTFSGTWEDVGSAAVVEDGSTRKYIKLQISKHETVMIPSSIQGFDRIVSTVQANVKQYPAWPDSNNAN